MDKKIPVGISACLLGERVRFDGGHKRSEFAAQQLAPFLRYEPVCPEMAIGLPTPRPALRLTEAAQGEISLCFSNGNDLPVTEKMQAFSEQKVSQLHHLCGYIVCAKSPSCGMERVRIYQPDNNNNRKAGTGVFTRELMEKMPWLPVEEDGRLHDPLLRENFVARVYALHEFNQLWRAGLTRAKLMAFHTQYKLLLLAHSQPAYRQIGPFVAKMDQWASLEAFAHEYRQRLMDLMQQPATRTNHTNVLMHVQGYFRRELTSAQRQELAGVIDDYRQGLLPLLAPITLLKHYMTEFPHPWLAGQRYFAPYPEALRLRYGH
ncbi:YbgA family protein [Erwinia tasmaniensis]|uniref:Pathogenicity island protein n=1 Tax=Erwinia tasmaniensis (strain DSM 17950 / CFBP 7177 / CIP 109463 / NCPPB 4357 / Et1/99) TaxID=465817 RepID=B2VBP9_ERWT9|nr:2-thiouracil desulfurase family protein [Erwinia tasmaniensis]CAO97365.1 Putative pathogenicity island protein [Erwinia tasmaniensis Et1/99]